MTWRRRACVWLIAVAISLVGLRSLTVFAAAPPQASVSMFRVYLKDGTALACWGEYSRVGDRLVLTVPIGQGARTAYEFVSLPLTRVDLARTERYAEAVRAAQFASGRGASEYTALREHLSAQLASLSALPDPKARLAAAEAARQQLLDWADGSHGYRAKEVQQLLQLLDSAIIDLRVAAGESRFSINLSTGNAPPPPPKLRAAPTTRETIQLAVKAAAVADAPETRLALLKRARTTAARLNAKDPGFVALRELIDKRIAIEARIDASYRQLGRDIRRLAVAAVDRGDVLALDALRQRVLKVDRALGRQRPNDVAALLAGLDADWEPAVEQRLVLDKWEADRTELVEYQTAVASLVKTLDGLAGTLTAIRQMSGPPLTSLVRAERQTAAVVALYADIVAPDAAGVAHAALGRAIEQADLAVRTRHRAVELRQIAAARDAAAAATEARSRLVEAKDALQAAARPPKAVR
jgi:hypothetical protein